ncbi:biliverdin-producing heme oxygenase [Asaia astilbis]|uniref:biliverdin-producing heme oxygenase n=1 Tax=Asaia astilbis TaxID=610244 RepID=UPI0004700B66|nr:biliverdin-producing heme oxygenase [Asaia astilbis]
MLRDHVHGAHERLDGLIGALGTKRDYDRYVLGMAAFRSAAETALEIRPYPVWLSDWRPVSTRAALARDMTSLCLLPLEVPEIAPPETGSSLLGMLYTLEGSALGARIIAKRAMALGFDEAHGASHLALQTGAPENWRKFLTLLEEAPEFDPDEAGAAALLLFSHAYNALTRVACAGSQAYG